MPAVRFADFLTVAHPDILAAVGAATASVDLVSPILSAPVARALTELAAGSSARWRLLTGLDPRSIADGVLNLQGLRWLLAAGVQIRSIPYLHAKVTLCDDTFGLVGSANLTRSGLGSADVPNLELGVRLSATQLQGAHEVVDAWWDAADPVTAIDLSTADQRARQLPRLRQAPAPYELLVDDTAAVADALLLLARERTLWAKAVYGDGYEFTGPEPWISSSRRGRPTFAPGDLVLIYAAELGRCTAVVEIMEPSRWDPDLAPRTGGTAEDGMRWPWVNPVRRLLAVGPLEAIEPDVAGFTVQALQSGHKRLDLSQFAAALRAFAGRDDLS